MQQHVVYPWDRVVVTADQSYEVTWDDVGYREETGVILSVDHEALSRNLMTGTTDYAPYLLLLDRGGEASVAEVEPLTDDA